MTLRNKRILITAGPTWVAIDKVRIISNLATGETGIILAKKLSLLGACVTLLLGQTKGQNIPPKIRLIPYCFFDDLYAKMIKELKTNKYDIVIHSAAVCDYKPAHKYNKKKPSGSRIWNLKLKPTPKIIDLIKKIPKKDNLLVGFKYEPNLSLDGLIKESKKLIMRTNADIVVGNSSCNNHYKALIISRDCRKGPFNNKIGLANNLIKELQRMS